MKKFTKTHEWIDTETGYMGITSHAQEKIGDIVFVDLPKVNAEAKKGEVLLSIESVKSTSDIYSPVSGKIIEVNSKLDSKPELVNESAENEGWIAKIQMTDKNDLNDLMDEKSYKEFCKND
jgi:glycine cleavage system H protein